MTCDRGAGIAQFDAEVLDEARGVVSGRPALKHGADLEGGRLLARGGRSGVELTKTVVRGGTDVGVVVGDKEVCRIGTCLLPEDGRVGDIKGDGGRVVAWRENPEPHARDFRRCGQ